jgi:LysM repeat protein
MKIFSKKTMLAGLATTGAATFLTTTDASADSYQVKDGDTLSEIAEAHGTTVDALVKLNNLGDANFILTGASLVLSTSSEVASEAVVGSESATVASVAPVTTAEVDVNATSYVVQAGDTLFAISRKFGVSLATLVGWNNLRDASLLLVGQTLTIKADAEVAPDFSVEIVPGSDVEPQSQAAPEESVPADSMPSSEVIVESAETVAESEAPVVVATPTTPAQTAPAATGSVYDQFIAAGGTDALWTYIVVPESGGNPNAQSPAGYHGLGQTLQSWGWGTVAEQTAGMINYATNRYGSVDNAVQFRLANGWW